MPASNATNRAFLSPIPLLSLPQLLPALPLRSPFSALRTLRFASRRCAACLLVVLPLDFHGPDRCVSFSCLLSPPLRYNPNKVTMDSHLEYFIAEIDCTDEGHALFIKQVTAAITLCARDEVPGTDEECGARRWCTGASDTKS